MGTDEAFTPQTTYSKYGDFKPAHAPSLAVFGGSLHMAYDTSTGTIMHSYWSGSLWTFPRTVAGGIGGAAYIYVTSKKRHPIFQNTIAVLKGDETAFQRSLQGTGDD